ncbi:hypothetical protein ACQP3F_33020, partial [Escherichia coli]
TVPHSSVKCERLFPKEFSLEKALWVVASSAFRFYPDVFFKASITLFPGLLYHHGNHKINKLDKNPWKTLTMAIAYFWSQVFR